MSQLPAQAALPPQTRLGSVHLTVADLERQIRFYTQVLGFTLHSQGKGEAALGTESETLLRLTEDPGAPRVTHATGMYHFALLYPSRKELARAIARLFAMRYPNAPTDHGASKTTYLDDPEGNTIELYVRSLDDAEFIITNGQFYVRYADGRIGTGRDPLDVEALFRELDVDERLDLPLPHGTCIGHVHLYGSSLHAMMGFYRDVIGFQEGPIIEGFRMGDVGLDAQQPHVIAWNTWKGANLPPTPPRALGMRYFTVVLPDTDSLHQAVDRLDSAGTAQERSLAGLVVRDPSQIALVLTDRMA